MLHQATLPHRVQIRVGGVSLICNPVEKVPFASTKLLARGSDAVLGNLQILLPNVAELWWQGLYLWLMPLWQ